MSRRVFCPSIRIGSFQLGNAEAHHVRDVLRLMAGEAIELFDLGGHIANAVIGSIDREAVIVRVEAIHQPNSTALHLTLATAVPKADRADWMVEKLSELGVTRWIPLKTARSVVHPAGAAKFDRWRRIAIEAAKQSHRTGVMEIGDLTDVAEISLDGGEAMVMSTRAGCRPLTETRANASHRLLLVGPEGGWTDDELNVFVSRGVREAALTATVLRIETAAIVAATIALLMPSPV